MIATDVAIAVVLGALFFVHDRSDVWIIYAVTFLYGAAGFLFTSGQSALLHLMLPEEQLADANAVIQTASEGSRLIAPLIGAGIFAAVGGPAVAALDGRRSWPRPPAWPRCSCGSRGRSPRSITS